MPDMPRIAEQMKAHRKVQGISQEELAHQMGVCTGTISRLERGWCKRPSRLLIGKLREWGWWEEAIRLPKRETGLAGEGS